MTKSRIVSSTVLAAAFALAATASAQDKKAAPAAAPAAKAPAAPAAAAKAAAPAAAAPQPMPPSGPSKELEAFFKGAEGTWKCETKIPAGAMGKDSPEMTFKTTTKIKKEMGGMWYRGDYSAPKSKAMPAMSGTFLVGWEPTQKQVLVTQYDSMGGTTLSVGTISGDTMTYAGEGYGMGMKMKTKESMTVKGKEATHKMEMDMGHGFMPAGEDTCKK